MVVVFITCKRKHPSKDVFIKYIIILLSGGVSNLKVQLHSAKKTFCSTRNCRGASTGSYLHLAAGSIVPAAQVQIVESCVLYIVIQNADPLQNALKSY